MMKSRRSARARGAWLRSFLCAGVALLWGSVASAGTILQYAQTNPLDVVTATESGGVTTLSTAGNTDGGDVSIPVTISNFLGVPGLTIPAFETFVGVTSNGAAVSVAGQLIQGFNGTIEITSGIGGTGSDYLTATFTNLSSPGVLSGTIGGGQAQLSATDPPQSLILTSDFAAFKLPTSMTLGFSGIMPSLGITSGSTSGFTGQATGTFGAGIVPEPASIGMSLMGIFIVSLAVANKRRRRP